jgi:penicillin V acylase-like amidase (Ntn superfamily)
MRKFNSLLSATLISFSLFSQTASPCTIFSLYPKNEHWVGRTYDWSYGHGLIFTNEKNVTKKALQLLPSDVPLTWTSNFGSVTFNQFGKEFPTGGMNEKGMVIEALELLYSRFPDGDARPSFNELQFMQYVLDNYSSVEDLNSDLPNIRLAPVGSKLHYFTCDVKKCMTIEFLEGKVVTHFDKDLSISGLANNSYEHHVKYASKYITFGGNKPIDMESHNSLDRFVRSNYRAKYINQSPYPTQSTFTILDDVSKDSTRWHIIYNQTKKLITFRTTAKINLQREIDLKNFNYDCKNPSGYFDIDNDLKGSINQYFLPFDAKVNHEIIKKSVKEQGLPDKLADRLAIYPAETKCESN